MALPIETDELRTVWRALARQGKGDGWRTIRVATDLSCQVFAAVHFPGDEESLLFGFDEAPAPAAERLPGGSGFIVNRINPGPAAGPSSWYALTRQPAGGIQLFEALAHDVLCTLRTHAGPQPLQRMFIKRLQDWQAFMRRAPEGVIGAEAVVGLYGELTILEALIDNGMPARLAIEAWTGPLESSQDFVLSPGALEVKTVVGATGFPVTISSLEQLDEALASPLFLAGVRLIGTSEGITLPELIGSIRDRLAGLPATGDLFESRLASAGYIDAMSHRYDRSYHLDALRFLRVDGNFPHLARSSINPSILGATYRLDLDRIAAETVQVEDMLKDLEVI